MFIVVHILNVDSLLNLAGGAITFDGKLGDGGFDKSPPDLIAWPLKVAQFLCDSAR